MKIPYKMAVQTMEFYLIFCPKADMYGHLESHVETMLLKGGYFKGAI